MAGPVGTVTVKVVGDVSSFRKSLDKGSGAIKSFSTGAVKTVAAVGAAFTGVGLLAGAALLKIGDDFNEANKTIRIGTGATGEALEGLQDNFKNIAKTVPDAIGDTALAIADLNTRLGLSGEPLEVMTKQALDLARITGGDLANQIKGTARVIGDWGIATEKQVLVNDKLFRASQFSGVAIEELQNKVVQFGAPLRQLGFSMEDSIALFSKFGKEGVNAETVMAGVRQAVSKFAREGKNLPDAFSEAVESIGSMEDASRATSKAIEIFGARAGPDMAAAIREGKFELGDYMDAIENGADTVSGLADETLNWKDQLQILKNKALVKLEPIATRLFTFLSDWFTRNGPAIAAGIERIGAVVTRVLTPVMAWLRDNAPPILIGLRMAFDDAVTAITELWEEWGPDVMAAITPIMKLLRDRVPPIMEDLRDGFVSVVEDLGRVWEIWGPRIMKVVGRIVDVVVAMAPAIIGIIKGLVKIATGLWDVLVGVLTGDWGRAWDGIKSVLSGAVSVIVNVVKGLFNGLKALFAGAPGLLVAGLSKLPGLFVDVLKLAFRLGKGAVKLQIKVMEAIFVGLPRKIISALGSLKDVLKQKGKDLINGMINGIKSVAKGVPKAIAGAIPGGGVVGKGLSFAGFADGGRPRVGQDVIVGERGPELFRADRPGTIIPNHELGGAGGDVNINMPVTTNADPVVMANELVISLKLAGVAGR